MSSYAREVRVGTHGQVALVSRIGTHGRVTVHYNSLVMVMTDRQATELAEAILEARAEQ
jgi:hypothetical protein